MATKRPRWVAAAEGWFGVRRRWRGINRFPDPYAYFGPGGVPEAEETCARANRDLMAYLAPPRTVQVRNATRTPLPRRRGGIVGEEWRFNSPLPSGDPDNDRVQLRLYRREDTPAHGRVILFHHPIYQRDWGTWLWFVAPLTRIAPVAIMAAPHHFGRKGRSARYAGEMSMNPNPARLFEAIRQWCWDHTASVRALSHLGGLDATAVVGYSFGAFQSMLFAAAGGLDQPIVSIASTNRYAFGLLHGVLGDGVIRGMERVGIDRARLERLVESLQLERHVGGLPADRVLYVRGLHDDVDPHPSLERLETALSPQRAIRLDAGHATLVFLRDRILNEAIAFLRERDAIPDASRAPDGARTSLAI